MKKKSQVALEFLTTYGWAFLVVLVMIGALAYFGVLDPSNFLPEKCIFGAGIGCIEYAGFAGPTGNISARLVNGFGYAITIEDVTATVTGEGGVCDNCSTNNDCTMRLDPTWLTEEEKEFVLDCPDLSESHKPRVMVEIKYMKSGGTYSKMIRGELQVKPSD